MMVHRTSKISATIMQQNPRKIIAAECGPNNNMFLHAVKRKLKNITLALICTESRSRNNQVTVKELPAEVQLPVVLQKTERAAGGNHSGGPVRSLNDMERSAILDALAQCHGNKKKAAELLGIQRPTLYNKMRRYAIEL